MISIYGDAYDPSVAPVRFEDLSQDFQRAYYLYTKIQHQVIIAPSGAIMGLDIQAIKIIFDFYNVLPHKQQSLFEKIQYIQFCVSDITKLPEESEDTQSG